MQPFLLIELWLAPSLKRYECVVASHGGDSACDVNVSCLCFSVITGRAQLADATLSHMN